MAFTYALKPEFEGQITQLVREFMGGREFLSVHHPDEPDARDDRRDAATLSLLAGAGNTSGDVFVAFDGRRGYERRRA